MIFHCTAFGVDNTNTNIKAKNSIKSRVRALNPTVYFVECPCHIIQNAAQKGAEAFRDLDIEECCVHHFNWFDKSTKRKGELNEYSLFCDTSYRGFFKYINARWLSFKKPLIEYFKCLLQAEHTLDLKILLKLDL